MDGEVEGYFAIDVVRVDVNVETFSLVGEEFVRQRCS